jgi:hypothetical protein
MTLRFLNHHLPVAAPRQSAGNHGISNLEAAVKQPQKSTNGAKTRADALPMALAIRHRLGVGDHQVANGVGAFGSVPFALSCGHSAPRCPLFVCVLAGGGQGHQSTRGRVLYRASGAYQRYPVLPRREIAVRYFGVGTSLPGIRHRAGAGYGRRVNSDTQRSSRKTRLTQEQQPAAMNIQ